MEQEVVILTPLNMVDISSEGQLKTDLEKCLTNSNEHFTDNIINAFIDLIGSIYGNLYGYIDSYVFVKPETQATTFQQYLSQKGIVYTVYNSFNHWNFVEISHNMINIHESLARKTFVEKKFKLCSSILIGKDCVNFELKTMIYNHQNDGNSCGSYSLIYMLLKSIKFDIDLFQFNFSSNINDIRILILQDVQHYVFQSKQANSWLSIQCLIQNYFAEQSFQQFPSNISSEDKYIQKEKKSFRNFLASQQFQHKERKYTSKKATDILCLANKVFLIIYCLLSVLFSKQSNQVS